MRNAEGGRRKAEGGMKAEGGRRKAEIIEGRLCYIKH